MVPKRLTFAPLVRRTDIRKFVALSKRPQLALLTMTNPLLPLLSPPPVLRPLATVSSTYLKQNVGTQYATCKEIWTTTSNPTK